MATHPSISQGMHFSAPSFNNVVQSLGVIRLFCSLLLTLYYAGQTYAAEIQKIDIQYSDKTYSIAFKAVLDADFGAVERIVTNHANLKTLSSRVTTSELLPETNDDNVKLKLVLKPCVLFYCKTLTKTSDVYVTGSSTKTIRYTADPEFSSFKVANELLTVERKDQKTELNYTATIVPGFRVPPVIGPWLVKRVLRKELIEVGENVEKQASDDSL